MPDPSDLSGGGSGPKVKLPAFRGGGGNSGGAGASVAFDGPAANVRAAFVPPSADAATSSSGVSDAVGEAASGIFDFDDDSVVLIAIGVLLAAIFGAAIYLIYIAPHILSEAAFNFLLGSSLIRSYRKMNNPDWMGSVFKDTYIPFVIVLPISLGAALVIHKYAPGITRISDFFQHLGQKF